MNNKNKLLKKIIEKWKFPRFDEYYNLNIISSYFHYKKSVDKANKINKQILNDNIVNDFDLDELFVFLDRTSSKIGQQYLYYRIRTLTDTSEKIINYALYFANNDKARLDIQLMLNKINNNKTYNFTRLLTETYHYHIFHKYLIFLSLINILSLILITINPIFLISFIITFFINSVLHYKNKKYINFFFEGINQMSKANKIGKKIYGYDSVFKVKDDTFIKEINNLKKKTKYIQFSKQLETPNLIFFWLIYELLNITFNIENLVFNNLLESIKNKKEYLDNLFIYLGEIDAGISSSYFLKSKTVCIPKFTSKKKIKVKKVYHPLIINCVKNDLFLNEKSLLLTGSNMSGKTTFIRTIAINSILSQTLGFCFAEEFTIPRSNIVSSIRIEDDMFSDKSYFLEEVIRIKEFLNKTDFNKINMIFLDEIFKGTNTIERIASAEAILSYLNKQNNIIFVSTHDTELVELLKNKGFELFHFEEKIIDKKITFDYKIKKGHVKSSNAIKILEIYNFPLEIINNALETKQKLLFNKMLPTKNIVHLADSAKIQDDSNK